MSFQLEELMHWRSIYGLHEAWWEEGGSRLIDSLERGLVSKAEFDYITQGEKSDIYLPSRTFERKIELLFSSTFGSSIGKRVRTFKEYGFDERKATRLALKTSSAPIDDIEVNCKGKSLSEIENWISEHFIYGKIETSEDYCSRFVGIPESWRQLNKILNIEI